MRGQPEANMKSPAPRAAPMSPKSASFARLARIVSVGRSAAIVRWGVVMKLAGAPAGACSSPGRC